MAIDPNSRDSHMGIRHLCLCGRWHFGRDINGGTNVSDSRKIMARRITNQEIRQTKYTIAGKRNKPNYVAFVGYLTPYSSSPTKI